MKNLLFLLLFIPLVSFGQDNMYYVSSEGGLNVRDKPGSDGKKIATLLFDDLVYLLEKTDISLTLNDLNKSTGEKKEISGQWIKIKTHTPPKLKGDKILWEYNDQNIEGYVFDGFLKKIIVSYEQEIVLKYSNYRLEIGELESSIIPENQEVYNYGMQLIDLCSEKQNGYGNLIRNNIKPCTNFFEDDWKKVYKNLYKNKFLIVSYFKSTHYQNKLIIKKVELLDDLLKSVSDDSNISSKHIITKFDDCKLEDASYQKQFAEYSHAIGPIEDQDKFIYWSCSKVHIDLGWDINKNSHKKQFYDEEELVYQGENIFYYAFKSDNEIHIGGDFELKDDNIIILYDAITKQQNFDKSTREAAKTYRNLSDISELNKLNLYAYTRDGKFPLELIDSKINRLPIYCENEGFTKQIEISYKKIESEILFISSADLPIENSFIKASPLKDKQWANDNDSLLFPSSSENKNVTLYKFGKKNNTFIASVSGIINTVRGCEPEWDDSHVYNCEINLPDTTTFNAYYYIEGDKVLLLSYFDDEIKGFQDINNDGILDIVMRKRIYFSNENGFYIYNLITNQVERGDRC
jgi:hypothetical protein